MPLHIIVGAGGREYVVERRGSFQSSERDTGPELKGVVGWCQFQARRRSCHMPVLSWREWSGWCGSSCVELCGERFCTWIILFFVHFSYYYCCCSFSYCIDVSSKLFLVNPWALPFVPPLLLASPPQWGGQGGNKQVVHGLESVSRGTIPKSWQVGFGWEFCCFVRFFGGGCVWWGRGVCLFFIYCIFFKVYIILEALSRKKRSVKYTICPAT